MAANPIFIETEEEVPAVIERIKRTEASEVPLVLPARSRFAQSRFNFQLLGDYALRLGKRVAIISPDPAVQRMAEETGFPAYRGVDHYVPVPEEASEASPAAKVVALPTQPVQPTDSAPAPTKVGVRLVPPATPTPAPGGEVGAPAEEGGGVPPTGAPVPALAPVTPLAGPSVRPRQPAPVRIVPPATRRAAARRPPRIKVSAPRPLPSRLAAQRPSRIVLYAGALLVLVVGMVSMVVFVPSAKVTLVTEAVPYNTPIEVSGEPNKPALRIRTATVSKNAAVTQKATGVKTIPGALAIGNVAYANNCPTGFVIPDGQVLAGATGVQFAQKGPVTIGPKSVFGPPATAGAPVVARAPGGASNTPGGPVGLQPAGDAGGCLAAVLSATAGGTDEQKKTVISTADYANARSSLEAQLRKQATEDLGKQVQGGEKLAEAPVTLSSDFAPSKKVDEEAGDFSAALTLKVEGAFYMLDDVNRAFATVIEKNLPAGQQLTGNRAKIDYAVSSATAGGHLTFKGTASAYLAPKLDLAKVKSQLPGKSTARARTDLARLPGVRSVRIDESPFKLPILPLASSRIDLEYVVSQAPPTRSG